MAKATIALLLFIGGMYLWGVLVGRRQVTQSRTIVHETRRYLLASLCEDLRNGPRTVAWAGRRDFRGRLRLGLGDVELRLNCYYPLDDELLRLVSIASSDEVGWVVWAETASGPRRLLCWLLEIRPTPGGNVAEREWVAFGPVS